MSHCRRTLMACLQSGAVNQRRSVLYENFNHFCSYSPELPDWFKFPQGEKSWVDSKDDFVLPTKLEFLEDSVSNRTQDCRTDVRIVSHDSKDVDLDDISRILKSKFASPEAVFVALDHCSVKISEGLVNTLLRRFSNDWVPAFGFFMWAGTQIGYKHSSHSYDMMVDILGKSKQFDVMWGLIDEMVRLGGLVSLTTMTKVMRRLAGACRWNEAIKTFHDIEQFGIKKDTLAMNTLLDTLCKERSIKHAIHAFLELRNEIPPNASSFNVIIHGWCKARKLEEAWQTMKEMRNFGFNPCVITYTSLIEAYCMEKNFRMVDAILGEMHTHGCPPNIVTYTIIMHALGKAKETHEALKVFDKMKRDGCTPDTSFYNSLIYILGRAGRLRDANDIYEEMCKSGISPNVNTYNTLISAACDHSQEESALKLLLKMEESSCNSNTLRVHSEMKRAAPWEQSHPVSSDDSSDSDSDDDKLASPKHSTKNRGSQSSKDIKLEAADSRKKKLGGMSYEALSRHGYHGGPSVLKVPPPRVEEKEPDWSWSTGKHGDADKDEESYEERERTRAAIAQGEKLSNVQTNLQAGKEKKNLSFSQKEKRKRDLGQASRGKNYVEEEKRLLRESGIYSGFDS